MSEKKLRSLLAEARDGLWPDDGEPNGLCQRIDAALAEPVVDDFQRGVRAMRDAIMDRFMCPPYDGCNNGRQPDTCDDCKFAYIVIDMPTPEDK